ncbi:MAG: cupin-like domain-containing protein [Myxococcota bacterium]
MAPADDPQTLHPRWRGWIAENLAQGTDVDAIVSALVEEGVPESVARDFTAEIAASPAINVARRLYNRVTALETMVKLRRSHRDDHGPPIERLPLPDAETLRRQYLASATPAIFTDLVPRWPALGKWSPQYLAERFGDVEVTACVGRNDIEHPDADWEGLSETMSMRALVERITDVATGNDTYLIAKNTGLRLSGLAPLLDDLPLEPAIFGETKTPERMGIWIGGKGTHTPLHHDGDNSFFCQIYGRKRVRLAPPESLPLLDRADGVYSRWDPTSATELAEGPETLVEVEVAAGEALLIPAGWWHQVDALDVSITVTILELAWPNDYNWYRPGTLLRGRAVPQ